MYWLSKSNESETLLKTADCMLPSNPQPPNALSSPPLPALPHVQRHLGGDQSESDRERLTFKYQWNRNTYIQKTFIWKIGFAEKISFVQKIYYCTR